MALLGYCVLGVGCASPSRLDLARNTLIYRTAGYVAPRQCPAPVFVQPLRDAREKVPTFRDASFDRTVYADNIWERPVPVMVEELLVDEIERSRIFARRSTAGAPVDQEFVVEPSLLALHRYREAAATGLEVGRRRTVAYTAIRLVVKGPVDGKGQRHVLLDRLFHNEARTPLSLARAEHGIALTGQTLQVILAEMLPKLYETTIVPVPALPAKR
ncbi:MAG: hypothetical protein H6837_02355 [Planctomycetes bacterium]|nr:hypothetical protein [Planctomycetota bacterium]